MLAPIARALLRILGWRAVGVRPDVAKMVIVAYPHTSNWDLFFYLLVAWEMGVPLAWMGKDTLFRPPLGWLLSWLNGIPIHRDRRENVVEQMQRNFAERDELCLLIAAEGTRSYVEQWKSGFYHIARAADVPLALAFIDYPRRESGLGPLIYTSGDVSKDMDELRAFYDGRVGLYPEYQGRIRLHEEESDDDPG
jgi:1-acyl-sn-glycerol-3-phosphate acyltransferase